MEAEEVVVNQMNVVAAVKYYYQMVAWAYDDVANRIDAGGAYVVNDLPCHIVAVVDYYN